MNIIDISLLINKYPIVKAKKLMSSLVRITESEKKAYINNRKNEIVNYHLENNCFYKNKVNVFKKWEDLPILTKKDIQVPLQKRLSKGFYEKNTYTNKTSGSTGNPFFFAKDKFCHALTWASIQYRFGVHGLYGKKQARFYGLPKSSLAKFKERLKDFFSNRYRFNVFDLSNKALETWVLNFKKNKYVYLNGYTTVLVLFAKFLIKKETVLKQICPTIKACVVTSEMCSMSDRELMKKGFGVPVINEYGASELDLIAFEDEELDWVVNTESIFVEILDDNNKVLPYGNSGRIVITALYNKAHPFIRYDVGDIGCIVREKGKLILKDLIGRKEDYVKLPSGKTSPGLTFYYVTKSLMEKSQNVNEIKVIQKELNIFEIHYVAENPLSLIEKNRIEKELTNYLEPNLIIRFYKFEFLERSQRGKLKQFQSLI